MAVEKHDLGFASKGVARDVVLASFNDANSGPDPDFDGVVDEPRYVDRLAWVLILDGVQAWESHPLTARGSSHGPTATEEDAPASTPESTGDLWN